MYYDHFGLSEAPFKITPNTDFFFSGGNRGPVLDALVYAITRGEGMVKVTGEVGSGKTTFVQQLVRQMGNTESVVSPTYVLMKKYKLPDGLNPFGLPRRFKTIVHIDAYRLEDPAEFKALQPEEFLNDPSNLVVVEWPEKLGTLLPTPDVVLRFINDGIEGERRIEMRGTTL